MAFVGHRLVAATVFLILCNAPWEPSSHVRGERISDVSEILTGNTQGPRTPLRTKAGTSGFLHRKLEGGEDKEDEAELEKMAENGTKEVAPNSQWWSSNITIWHVSQSPSYYGINVNTEPNASEEVKFEANYSISFRNEIGQSGNCASKSMATETSCVLRPHNTFQLSHFPHAAEAQLACFSLFERFPSKHRTIVLTNNLRFGDGDFTTGLQRLMHYGEDRRGHEPYPRESGESKGKGCFVYGMPKERNSTDNPWIIDKSGIRKLQSLVNLAPPNIWNIINIGILNRRLTRRFDYAKDLIASIVRGLDSASFSVNTIDDMADLSFRGQAQWAHNQDVIIAPHGAQNTNFMWIRECTAVLEMYPPGYFVPGYFLPLSEAAGAVNFVGYPGPTPWQYRGGGAVKGCSGEKSPAKCRTVLRAQNFVDTLNVTEASTVLEKMLTARAACLRETAAAAAAADQEKPGGGVAQAPDTHQDQGLSNKLFPLRKTENRKPKTWANRMVNRAASTLHKPTRPGRSRGG